MSTCLCKQTVMLPDAVNSRCSTFLYEVLIILLIVANFDWFSKKFHGNEVSMHVIISMRGERGRRDLAVLNSR